MSDRFSLYLVTDSKIIGQKGILEVVAAAVEGGVSAVQLREKGYSSRDFVEMAKKIRPYLCKNNIPLIINDRVDIAKIVDADGVHLGQSDVEVADARNLLGLDAIIGLTIENLSQSQKIDQLQLDYIGVSAIYPTRSKLEITHYWSKEEVSTLRKQLTLPLIGIGGINQHNARNVLAYGLDGIAVVSAICGEDTIDDVRTASRELKKIVEEFYAK